jgi:signal transduction histidine kinase
MTLRAGPGLRRDVAVAVLLTALGVAATAVRFLDDTGDTVTAATYAGTAVLGAAAALARTRPRAAWMIGLAAYVLVIFDSPSGPLVPYACAWYLTFVAGRHDGGRISIVACLLVGVSSEVASVVMDVDSAMYSFLAPGIWFAGRAVRKREQLAHRLEERAWELDEEREAFAQLSVRYERARIASDLHDIVAHALSVMVVQAGAGQRLAGVDEELTAETFAAIAESARQAEQDMERLVALLGDEDAIGPAPDLDLVQELVTRATSSGLDVSLRLEGEREGLPTAAVEAGYRVVQESLTNALRYASGARVHVLVKGEADALLVEVVNGRSPADAALAGAGTGNGLRGLRERVGHCGGWLEAGPTGDGGWRVAAHLPRRVAVPA